MARLYGEPTVRARTRPVPLGASARDDPDGAERAPAVASLGNRATAMDEIQQSDAGEPDPVGFRDREGEFLADPSRGSDRQLSRQLAIACVATRS